VSRQTTSDKIVLIAEDYTDISELVGDLLHDEGYPVVVVDRGAEVLPTAIRTHPSLILLDLSLPDIPGNEVLQELNVSPATTNIPVVIVSAYSDQLRRVPQVKAVVNKPFDLATLLQAVQDAQQPRPISA